MPLLRAVRFAGVALLSLSGCRDSGLAPLTEAPPYANIFQRAISEPVTLSSSNIISEGTYVDQTYVAFREGDLPDALSVRISNISKGSFSTIDHPFVDGALDPVAVAAAVGDTLELGVTNRDGGIALLRATVPTRRPPRVIRTNPPRGRTAVSVNSRIRVVFSEPMEPGSITANTLRLSLGSQPVEGRFVFDGPLVLAAEFVPAQPLASASAYTLVVSGVRDLSGDALEESVTIEFSTGAALPNAGTLELTALTSGVDQDEDGYLALIQAPGFSSTDTLSAEGDLTKTLGAGTYSVTLAGVAANCSVLNGVREIVVAPGATVSLTFAVDCSAVAGQDVTNQEIVFVSGNDGDSEIYVVAANGTDLVRLTFNQAQDHDPAWSPDGTRIAFASNRSGRSEIYTMNANGSGVVRRTNTGYAASPAWSPDGRKIAFESGCDGQGCIKVISAEDDGTSALRLGHPQGVHLQPSWSPDGSEIAFVSDWAAFDFVYDVYVQKTDGSAIRQLTQGFGYYPELPDGRIESALFWHPTFSSRGKIALLQHRANLGTRDHVLAVATMNADGSGFEVITPAVYTTRFAGGGPSSLSWSPDGSSIAYATGTCSGPFGENCSPSISIVTVADRLTRVLISNAHSPAWRVIRK